MQKTANRHTRTRIIRTSAADGLTSSWFPRMNIKDSKQTKLKSLRSRTTTMVAMAMEAAEVEVVVVAFVVDVAEDAVEVVEAIVPDTTTMVTIQAQNRLDSLIL